MGALKRHPVFFLGITVTVLFLFFSATRVSFIESLDLKVYDLMMGLRTDEKSPSDVVLVDIDNDSLNTLGRWPWPRSVLAEGIQKISAAGPRLIGVNVIFSEPERSDGLKEIDRLTDAFSASGLAGGTPAGRDFLASLKEARVRLDNDAIMASVLREAGNVVLPVFFDNFAVVSENSEPVPAALAANALGEPREAAPADWPQADEAVLPIPLFMDAAGGLGHNNVMADREDGNFRRETPFIQYRGEYVPSFTVKLLQDWLKAEKADTEALPGRSVILGPLDIPINYNSQFLISFKGPYGTFTNVSFADVVTDKIRGNVFKNKLVIVASSAPGIGITLPTPVGSLPQGEFYANVIWAMKNKQFIQEPGWSGILRLLLILAMGAVIIALFPRVKAGLAAGVFAGLFIALIGASAWLFAGGLYISPTYVLLQLLVGYIGVVTIQYFVTETGKEKAEGESAETNRMLGVSFQSQGMLDMAFEKFRRCPVDDEMKSLLYNLGLDYERKRQLNKAAMVYEYIEETDPKYKDVAVRKTKLMQASETMVFGQGMFGGTGDGSLVSDGMDTKPTLGRYEVIKMLGKGAMGQVYLGQDPRINRTTAIKTVRFTDEFDEETAADMKKKFFREAESAGTLAHPHIVTIYDAGEEQDLAYIAMEYLEGDDLEKHIKPDTLLPMRKVIGYMGDIADALEYAHERGIVHRDIKPANIMLLKSGVVKVTDFGIARIQASSQTATGVVKGTPFYMSPEQIAGEKVDGRSDIFSMGVMLYQMLTGHLPFNGDTIAALMHQIMNVQHPDPRTYNPKIYKPLVGIIDKALEKDREKRYQKAGQMAAHLRELGKKIDVAVSQKRAGGK